jgi:hypothetical protein
VIWSFDGVQEVSTAHPGRTLAQSPTFGVAQEKLGDGVFATHATSFANPRLLVSL